MRWLLLIWIMAIKGEAGDSGSMAWRILNEVDYVHCGFLEMLNYASRPDVNHIRVREENLNQTKEYLKVFRIPYKTSEEEEDKQMGPIQTREMGPGPGYSRGRRAVVHAIPEIPCQLDYCPEPKIYDWMSYDEITAFVKTINATFPERVLVTSLGETAEGRQIWQVRIRRGPCDEDKNFLLEAGSIGREWMGPAVAVNFIWRLIYECLLAPGYTFYVIPLLNPDGYEYSRTTNPTWLKNRVNTSNENCTGVNINRNYSFKWGVSGSSLDQCSDVYNGGSAFSEVESQALQQGCTQCNNITMLMSLSEIFDGNGESIMYPWSYTESTAPDHQATLMKYATIFKEAAYDIHGVTYTVKQASFSFGPHSGTAIDWVTGVQNATAAFVLRLRGEGDEPYSHNTSLIRPTVEEAWAGFEAMVNGFVADDGDVDGGHR